MKVFDVNDSFNYGQIHSVVAPNMAIAEKIYLAKYPFTSIRSITLHSEYVEIAPQNAMEAANTASNS